MYNRPHVSVITVTKNNINGLRDTWASVMSQVNASFEWVVVDGASTDGTIEFMQEIIRQHDFINFSSGTDTGIYHAMNRGIRRGSGEYLLFLNAGDRLMGKNILSDFSMLTFDSDIVYGNLMFAYPDKLVSACFPTKLTRKFLMAFYLPHPATFTNRNVFERVGLFDETFVICGDYDFFWRAFQSKSVTFSHWKRTVTLFDPYGMSSQRSTLDTRNKERWRTLRRHLGNLSFVTICRALLFRNLRVKFNAFLPRVAKTLLERLILRDFSNIENDFVRESQGLGSARRVDSNLPLLIPSTK